MANCATKWIFEHELLLISVYFLPPSSPLLPPAPLPLYPPFSVTNLLCLPSTEAMLIMLISVCSSREGDGDEDSLDGLWSRRESAEVQGFAPLDEPLNFTFGGVFLTHDPVSHLTCFLSPEVN